MSLTIAATTAAALFFGSGSASAYPMPFRDEARRDPSLLSFRKDLLAAIAIKDANSIKSKLAPDVLTELGGGSGVAEFVNTWKLNDKNSDFWTLFGNAITRGGYFTVEDGVRKFEAPFAEFRVVEGADYEEAAVCDKNVQMRSGPNNNAPVLAALTYESVRLIDVPQPDQSGKSDAGGKTGDKRGSDWTKVKAHGKTGFLPRKKLIFQTDPFATLQKIKGQWKITWFGTASL